MLHHNHHHHHYYHQPSRLFFLLSFTPIQHLASSIQLSRFFKTLTVPFVLEPVRFSIHPTKPPKATRLGGTINLPARLLQKSRVRPHVYESNTISAFQILLLNSTDPWALTIFTLTEILSFSHHSCSSAPLHGSMNHFGQKRARQEYEDDLSAASEHHPQHFAGNTNGFATHQSTYDHQQMPFSSAGDVVAAGAGIFVPQFVVSSAEGTLGLATHRSSLPLVYTQASPQSTMLVNGFHSLSHGLSPVSGLHDQNHMKHQNPTADSQDQGYFHGQTEPRMTSFQGFPNLASYEDTENRYAGDSILSIALLATLEMHVRSC